jgi:hypothetical protein
VFAGREYVMRTTLEFECNNCTNGSCIAVINIDLQGGVGSFKPRVGCFISSALDKQVEWNLI